MLRWNFDRTFLRHLEKVSKETVSTLLAKVEGQYSRKESWDVLRGNPEIWVRMVYLSLKENQNIIDTLGPLSETRPGVDGEKSEKLLLGLNILSEHFVLLDQNKDFIVGRRDMKLAKELFPVRFQGETVGYVGYVPTKDLLNQRQSRLLRDLQSSFLTFAGIIILLSAILSLLLARKMVQPIKKLAAATHQLTTGDLSARIKITSKDELGTLSDDFNQLAFTLEKNEQARRQWMAEISHELRTPIAILRGEIEALQDEIRPLNQNALVSLHGEAVHLGRLADDLYQLAMADVGTLTYKKESLNLSSLLNDVCSSFENIFTAKGIVLTFSQEQQEALSFFGDDSRLRQLCANLLENAFKYTDQEGQVKVILSCHERMAVIDFQDSAPGVESSELEELLDRFYRSAKHRNDPGGAGLGLNICRNIVEGHQGMMTVQESPFGGLWVRVKLPIRESLQ